MVGSWNLSLHPFSRLDGAQLLEMGRSAVFAKQPVKEM